MDINPFAVAIARFRLIVAAMHACGIAGSSDAPAGAVHVASGDSLLHGDKFDCRGSAGATAVHEPDASPTPIYAIEDPDGLQRDPRPAVSRRRRQPAVHHGQGRVHQRALPRALDDLPPAVLARRAVHRAVLQPGSRRTTTADRPATSG